MKFNSIDAMDTYIEKLVRRKIQAFYTDWKNYDRVEYMAAKGSGSTMLLMVRDTGSFIYRIDDVNVENVIVNYYTDYEAERHDYYILDTKNLTVKKVNEDYVRTLAKRKVA